MRMCWTCNTEHDLDDPCVRSMRAVSDRAAGGSALFTNGGSKLGPVFTATYDCEDACCGAGIEEGESIRADGEGGWVHATADCETGVTVKPGPCGHVWVDGVGNELDQCARCGIPE